MKVFFLSSSFFFFFSFFFFLLLHIRELFLECLLSCSSLPRQNERRNKEKKTGKQEEEERKRNSDPNIRAFLAVCQLGLETKAWKRHCMRCLLCFADVNWIKRAENNSLPPSLPLSLPHPRPATHTNIHTSSFR